MKNRNKNKNLNLIFTLFMAVMLLIMCISCNKKGDPEISEEEQRKVALTNTWTITNVMLDSEDVTADFTNFTLTVNANLGYSTNSITLS